MTSHEVSPQRIATLIDGNAADAVSRTASALAAGLVVAIPTDTVYGLAAAIDRQTAIDRLYEVKVRPASQPIPVLLGSRKDLDLVARKLSPMAQALADRFWPGALTLVVAARPRLATGLTSETAEGTSTVGVRVPDHQLTRAIIVAAGGALAVTSANRSGAEPALNAREVMSLRDAMPDYVVDGGVAPGAIPSTVVLALSSDLVILREGAVSREDIAAAVLDARSGVSDAGPGSAQAV